MEEERKRDPGVELEGVSRPSPHHTAGQGVTALLTILLLGTQEGKWKGMSTEKLLDNISHNVQKAETTQTFIS